MRQIRPTRMYTCMLIVTVAFFVAILACLPFAAPALAAAVVPITNDETGARTLAGAMVKDPGTIRGASFSTVPSSGTPHGVSPSLSFFPTAGDKFGIMTTGNSVFADAENTQTNSGEDLSGAGGEGRGNSAFDTSVLKLDLTAPEDANCLKFDFAFYSEEFPEFVNTDYNDTFIAELDNSTWTTDTAEIIAPDNFAFDAQGSVVSINSTGNTGMNDINAGGTTYDGATVLLEAAHKVTPGDHSLYLSILDQEDHVYDSAAFVDNVRFIKVANPDTDCKPGAQPVEDVKRNPLILVPGIAGSELNNSATGEEMWPRFEDLKSPFNEDAFLRDLKLDGSGQDAEPGEILRIVGNGVLSKDVYDTTILTLEDYGYTLNRDLFVFPFDWRKDIRSAPGGNFPDGTDRRLVEFIDHVREKSKLSDGSLPQVDIIAHSQGGLVTFSALHDQQSSGKVHKVLTLGTPVLGATMALGILQYQMPCFVDPVICLSHPPTVQEIVTTFPGAHQLLPSPAFDDAVGAPLRFDSTLREDGRFGEQGYDEWSALLKEDPDRNDTLIDDARLFHQEYDQLSLADPSVQLARVVGSKVDTPEVLRQYSHLECTNEDGTIPLECETVLDYEIVKGNGDETVNLHSADLYNPQAGFDMRGQNGVGTIPNIYANGVKHGDLPLDERVLGFANAYFGNRSSAPQTSAGAQTFSARPTAREENDPRTQSSLNAMGTQDSLAVGTESLPSEFGLTDAPEPFSGRELEVVGPADGFVQDAQGNILGHEPGQPEDNIYQEVPGGTYQAIDDTQTFFLNEGGTYSASLKVTGNEDVRLRVRDYVASKISGQAVFEVDAPVSAEVGVDFTNIQPLGDLRVEVDQNNDGTIDERRAPNSVVSGPASSETEPPNTTAVVKALGGSRHEITLSAEDGPAGSGVASTHYFVEGGQSEQLYSGPFTVAGGTTVNFYSVDKVGNAESLRKVTVVSDLAIAWGKQFGTSGADFVNGVALAPNGDAHVAGYVRSLVSGSTDASNDDATLGKYLAADGTGLWNKQFGTSTGDVAYDVAVDQQGNTYVVGKGDVVNRGSSGGFIVKYDAQGNTNFSSTSGNVWANQFTSGSVRTVAVDPDDNVYISVNINSDVYVYKYAPNGTLLTSKRFGAYGCYGTGLLDFAFGSTVGTRSDDPSVYVTGITAGQKLDDPTNCNVSSSENGMFLIKFDGTLNKRWDKQFGGPGGDGTPMDLAVDPENNAYVTGYTNNGAQIRDPPPQAACRAISVGETHSSSSSAAAASVSTPNSLEPAAMT